MSQPLPSFLEDHISQIPALQLLQNLGWQYLTPAEAVTLRGGKLGNVLLEPVLVEQLRKLNQIRFKGQEYEFSEANIQTAVQALKDVLYDGLVRTNEKIYDLLILGKSLQQTIDGDTKSFPLPLHRLEPGHLADEQRLPRHRGIRGRADGQSRDAAAGHRAVRQRHSAGRHRVQAARHQGGRSSRPCRSNCATSGTTRSQAVPLLATAAG